MSNIYIIQLMYYYKTEARAVNIIFFIFTCVEMLNERLTRQITLFEMHFIFDISCLKLVQI